MRPPRKPTAVEKIAGSPVTESALTVVAAMAGGAVAPLLPVLAKSLAAKRQQDRVDAALADISSDLAAVEAQLRTLTDDQYKLINEAVLAVFHTTQEEKLQYLRHAVRNAVSQPSLSEGDSIALGRIVRDLSAQEVAFLLRAFPYSGVQVLPPESNSKAEDEMLVVHRDTPEQLHVSGLLSLGVLMPGESSWSGLGVYRWSRYAGKLVALLRGDA
jgi:hypothetical protein